MRRRDVYFKLSIPSNIFQICNFGLISNSILINLNLLGLVRKFWSHQMSLSQRWLSHRVISDKVHSLFVTLSYFWPDRFVQPLSPIPISILLLYLLVSLDLVYNGICDLGFWNLPKGEKLSSKIYSNCSGAEPTISFCTTNKCQF